MRRRPAVLSLLAAGALVLPACSDESEVRPSGEIVGGNAGVDEVIDADITVQDVELAFVEGGYEIGDDADLYLAVTNTLESDAQLVEVRSDSANGVDGDLPITVPAGDNVYIGAEGEPDLELTDLTEARTSAQSVPVTFVFADGDQVTVEAVVAAQPQNPSDDDFDEPDPDPSSDN